MKHNKSMDEVIEKWLEIENEELINKKVQIDDNPIG